MNQDKSATSENTVITLADRKLAWPFRPSPYGEEAKEAWMRGDYDNCAGNASKAFARQRAMLTGSSAVPTPSAELAEVVKLIGLRLRQMGLVKDQRLAERLEKAILQKDSQ